MTEMLIAQFHFLRPAWLLALIPAAIIGLLLWRKKYGAQHWQKIVAPELLPYLLDSQSTRVKPWYLVGLACAWVICCIALAGPTWEKRPVAVEQNLQALVVILDLSPSMLSEDIKPSRLVRARLKIADILRNRQDGQTALVVYAGDAHVVTPLTDDTETINNIIPALHPNIMPAQGSNTEAAIERALRLLKDAAISQGDLLLITDGVSADADYYLRELMQRETNYRLSILGVGGATPSPIPSEKGGFIRDRSRNLVTTKLNAAELQQLAQHARGRYQTLGNTDSDIERLLDLPSPEKNETQTLEREFDSWYDRGHWLVLLLLPILLYSFRRGVFLSFLLLPLIGLSPSKSYALSWSELWSNNNQRAYQQLQEGQAEQAAQTFTDPDWQASAQYRAGDYEAAAKSFAQNKSATGHYNRGNALAQAQKLPEAIKAYEQALTLDPTLEDAKNNKKRVEELLKQQQEQQQDQNQDGDQNKDQNENENENENEKQSDKQQDQQDAEQNSSAGDKTEQDQQQQNQDSADQEQENQDQQNQKNLDQENKEQEQNQQEQESPEPNQEDAQQPQAQTPAEQQEAEQQEQEAQLAEPSEDDLTDEERQAMEQWLRRVPDDPGGLLRNKFNYEHYKRNQEKINGEWSPAENGAENRW